ncbi:MAG: hypothetical protein IJ043_09610 [Clostridia bacterium]|nr:hypothetical protein [Clostridia bacterium]
MKHIIALFCILLFCTSCAKEQAAGQPELSGVCWYYPSSWEEPYPPAEDGYLETEEGCWVTENGGTTFTPSITREQAVALAMEEAQKERYDYQPWESDFVAREEAVEQVKMLRLPLEPAGMKLAWSKSEIPFSLVWEVRLLDENDPLTNLILYLDVYSGEVVGGDAISD